MKGARSSTASDGRAVPSSPEVHEADAAAASRNAAKAAKRQRQKARKAAEAVAGGTAGDSVADLDATGALDGGSPPSSAKELNIELAAEKKKKKKQQKKKMKKTPGNFVKESQKGCLVVGSRCVALFFFKAASALYFMTAVVYPNTPRSTHEQTNTAVAIALATFARHMVTQTGWSLVQFHSTATTSI